jgi:uncharacterized protein YndB with AHSA1/START domain
METNQGVHSPLEITRQFAAPQALVFQCWTEPHHLVHWWGPVGMTLAVETLDLRPGGTFLYSMGLLNGDKMYGKFVYARVEAPDRLHFIVSFCDAAGTPLRHPLAPTWPLEVMNELVLEEADGVTTLRTTAYPIHANAEEQATFAASHDNMRAGSKGTYAQLDTYLLTLLS